MKYNNMFLGKFGLEREAVRIDSMGAISTKFHPAVFNEHNPYITKDFAEAQIEMITPPCDSIDKAVSTLEDIQSVVLDNLEGDLLWKQSNPPIINKDMGIPVARFESDPKKEEYRIYLSKKYGIERSIFSGIHYNFSFDESFLRSLYSNSKDTYESFSMFKNDVYLKLAKYILRDRWFFIYLTNASPVFHNSFYQDCVESSKQLDNGDCIIDGLKSLRNSGCGYRNKQDILLNFNSWNEYKDSVELAINKGDIIGPSELYTPIRLKENAEGNIEYIELRFLDINPFFNSGISRNDLKYIHLFMVYASMQDDFIFSQEKQLLANQNHNIATRSEEYFSNMQGQMNDIHNKLKDFYRLNNSPYKKDEIFKDIEQRIGSEDFTYSSILKREYSKSSYIDYHIERAILDKRYNDENKFIFRSFPELELSTKILLKESIKDGYLFDVIDASTNFISLLNPVTGQEEYIQQATKTNLDKYANVLAMENKVVTKKILEKHNLNVPTGIEISNIDDFDGIDVSNYENKGIVIKPNTTNFGEGISIYPLGAGRESIRESVEYSFTKDNTVLIEPFIGGKEYRFLIIGGKVVGVLHRRAANVIGDGLSTIKTLVEIKNKNPLRGTNYVTPLEKIKLGDIEQEFLSMQNLTINSIPKLDERIYLRENSNISTGGDSIDCTDLIHPSYIEIAEKSAQALGVSITGADIIIEDISEIANENNYSILELNFNPAIHIHTYPLEGINRFPAKVLLNELFTK